MLTQLDGSEGTAHQPQGSRQALHRGPAGSRLRFGDLLAGGGDQFVIGVRVPGQTRLPGVSSVSSTQVRPASDGSPAAPAIRLVNLADHRELLAAVQRARVGQHLHPDVAGRAIDVRQIAGRQLVREAGRVRRTTFRQ